MQTDLLSAPKVVGVKQTPKALREGRACRIFLAKDADPATTGPVAEAAAETGIPVDRTASMAQLGKACGISVGASVAAILRADRS